MNENKPERTGRLVPAFMKHIAANPKTAPLPMGKTPVRNGFTRLGSSVRMSKARQVDILKYFQKSENSRDAETLRQHFVGRRSFASTIRGEAKAFKLREKKQKRK